MDRRKRDEAVQAAHSRVHRFKETAGTLGVVSYSRKMFLRSDFTAFFVSKQSENVV